MGIIGTFALLHPTETIPVSLRARAALAAFALGLSGMAGVLTHPPIASAATSSSGYLMVDQAGHVYPFGSAPFCGHSDMVFSNKATDVEITPNNKGYWILIDGGFVDFEDCGMSADDFLAYEHNNIVPLATGEKAVSLSALPDGTGYWVFTNRGRAIPFGNAQFYGDMASTPLNGAILGSVATSTGKGYWMVGSDGGIFSFGNAKFYGSMGGKVLNKPVMSMAPDPDGVGYWLVASDGGIFAFDALFKGSMGGTPLNKPVSGMVPGANGYMMVGEDGGIFSFGDVAFLGSLGATPPSSPIRAVSLWTDDDVILGGAGTPPPPPPPPKPAAVWEWTTVDLDSNDPNHDVYGDSATSQTTPFTFSGRNQEVYTSCTDNGTYSYGCHFTLRNYATGAWEDGWSVDATATTEVRQRHVVVEPGTYYIEGSEYGDATIWVVGLEDERCTANCS